MSSRKLWCFFFVAACALAVVAASLWTADPDVFWHLKVGEWIARHRAVPKVDVYSWSAAGQPWTDHQWLWEVIIYYLYKHMGTTGLWLPVIVAGAGAGLLVYGAVNKSGNEPTKAAIAGGLAPVLLMGWLKPWPQAGVYASFAAYLYLSARRDWTAKDVVFAVFVALIWANIHSSVVMIPLLLLAETFWRNTVLKEKAGNVWLGAAASGLATLLNPHGVGLWVYAVREGLMTHAYRAAIAEWMPYYFGSPEMAASFFVSAAVVVAAAAQNRYRTIEFVRACGFWVLALLSRIYTPYAVLSTALLIGLLDFRFHLKILKLLTVVLLAFSAAVLVVRGVPKDLDAAAAKGKYPVKAVDYVLSHGGQKKIFNDYGFGGYLIWRGVPVYIDGRADLYRYKDIFLTYINSPQKCEEKLSQFVKKTGADAALVYRRGQFDRALEESPDWRRVYADDSAAVYELAR